MYLSSELIVLPPGFPFPIISLVRDPGMRIREISARNAKRAQCGKHEWGPNHRSPKRLLNSNNPYLLHEDVRE